MDFKLILALVLLAGGATGLLMEPPGNTGAAPAASATNAAATPQLANATNSTAWAESVVLPRADDGHFYADVEIEGQRLTMLVDTGASVVALTGADAERLGLTWNEADLGPVAQGASGAVVGVNTTIPEIALGDHVAHDVQALIIPEGLQVSLLGQAFLSTLGQVDMRGDEMVLGNAG